MVLLTMTPAIVRAVNQLQDPIEVLRETTEPGLKEPAVGKPISHGQVLGIAKALRANRGRFQQDDAAPDLPYHLEDLLRGSKVYVEAPVPKPEPTTEYKALMSRLRREEEDRAYERMVNPPPKVETFSQRFPGSAHAELFPTSQEDIGQDDEISYADINRQMALIINILVSIIACSVALWLAARHWSTPSRLGLSMGGSGAVAVAEAVIYAGYLRRLKEARDKGKKEIEIKEIIKTWVIGPEPDEAHQDKSTLVKPKDSTNENLRRRKQ